MANTVLDENVRYADASDVARYVRNKSFDSSSDPTKSEVEAMLVEATDEIDRRTNRAWRLREVTNVDRSVEFSHDVESQFRRRRRSTSRHGFVRPIERWGVVNLKHAGVESIEKLEVLLPESTEDITANKGRDSDWWMDYERGSLHVDVQKFTVGPLRGSGLVQPARVRVDYRYGVDQNASGADTTGGLSADVPNAVKRAAAKLVAAELLETDQYGSMVASGPEDVPSQNTAAQRLRDEADRAIGRWRHKKVM